MRRAGERYAWIVLFALGLGAVITGVAIVAGFIPNPPSAESTTGLTFGQIASRIPGIGAFIGGLSRQLGNFMIATGVLLAGTASGPYRRGERWAWYVCCIMPVSIGIQLANSLTVGAFLWQLDLASLVVVLAALFLPYRTFFPKDTAAQTG